jgi:hypothetical protein
MSLFAQLLLLAGHRIDKFTAGIAQARTHFVSSLDYLMSAIAQGRDRLVVPGAPLEGSTASPGQRETFPRALVQERRRYLVKSRNAPLLILLHPIECASSRLSRGTPPYMD